MIKLSHLDQTTLATYLTLIQELLKQRFPQKKQARRGPRRKWMRWTIVALALLKVSSGFTWRAFAQELKKHQALLQKHGILTPPSYGSLYAAWRSISERQMENLITAVGRILCPEPKDTAIDSTGFLFKGGSVWILLKWLTPLLKKTSRAFLKAHLLVDTTSRAILAVKLSKSPTHDIKMAEKVIKKVGKRRLRLVKRIFGDKAYTSRKLGQKLQVEYGIQLIVEPKRNAVDHGSNSWFDRSVRLYSRSASLWKHTHGYGRKSVVEQVICEVKKRKIVLSARKVSQKRKQLLLNFLQYNFAEWLELVNLR